MAEVSELKKKLENVNRELVKLETDSIFMIEEEERRHLMALLQAWKLREEAFMTEFNTGLLSEFSVCYDALDVLERFVNQKLDARFQALSMNLADPDYKIDELAESLKYVDLEIEELDEGIEESDKKERVLEKMVVTSKALLGEIKQELENSGRKTLAQWLLDDEQVAYLPYEWSNLNELRYRAIYTGIKLSRLLVHFVISLAGEEAKLRHLQSKIESWTTVSKKCMVARKFVILMDLAGYAMSEMKLKGALVQGSIVEEELMNKLIAQFFEAILDLESIVSFPTVPDTRRLVAGARIRLEDALGRILYSMQGLNLRIYKHNNQSWKRLKAIIAELWKDMWDLS